MRYALPLMALLAACSSAGPPSESQSSPSLALVDVTVIDGTGAPARPGMTVVVAGNRIRVIGERSEVRVPRDTEVVDGSGRYLIPGLWDMHVHMLEEETTLALYLANGVTGVRDLGSDTEAVLRLREEVRLGRRPGPRILTTVSMIDGVKQGAEFRIMVETPEQAREAVARLADRGADLVKIHNGLPRDAFFAVAAEARRRGLRLVGHVPRGIALEEALQAGQANVEHVSALLEAVVPRESMASIPAIEAALAGLASGERGDDVCREFIRNGAWFTPTLVAGREAARRVDPEDDASEKDDRLRYIAPPLRGYWDKYFPRDLSRPPEVVRGRWLVLHKGKEIVRRMHRAGVPLLAGTDVALRGVLPGFGLHDELELLVESGLTPLEALQTATRNPARFHGLADLGTIETGKLADLVLLDADPLADIRNTRRIRAVVADGKLLDRKDLDRMLADVEERVRAASNR